jgi:predicted dehydrogenase
MSKQTFKVAVIGTGMIANAGHLPAWKNLREKGDVEIVAVADKEEDRAVQTAKRHGVARGYGDWRKMLAECKPDIVSVCTPNMHHKDPTIGALKAGANVLCEKPMTTTYVNATEMFNTAKAAGRILMVGQSARFTNTTMAAKEFADAGQLGDVYYAETASMRRRGVPTWGVFHIKSESGGGPCYDLGVHALDSLLWVIGNPKVISAVGISVTKLANQDEGLLTSLGASGAPLGVYNPRPYDYHEFDVEDMAAGFLRLETGGAIGFKAAWAANIPFEGMGGTFIMGTKAGMRMRPFTIYSRNGRYMADISPVVEQDADIPFYGHWRET